MIRPATCLTMLLAAGSGLYLYQTKHQGYVLDQQIDTVLHETSKVHAHIAVLRAEYALMNDPSRLQMLAAAHLPALAPLAPGQFTTLAQLDSRLPPVAPPPAPPPPLDVATPPPAGVSTGQKLYDYPPAPVPAVPAVVASLQAPTAAPAAATAVHVVAVMHPAAPPPPPRRPRPPVYASVVRPQPRRVVAYLPAVARPDPYAIQAAAPPMQAQPSQVASALGMARNLTAPAVYQRYRPGDAETLAR